MITMDLREAIQLQSVYGFSASHELVTQLGQARDAVLAFLTAPLRTTEVEDE